MIMQAGGGNVEITNKPVKFDVKPKIPTAADAAKHKVFKTMG